MAMKTLAEQVGQTPHLSPLLRRFRRIGLKTGEDLRRLAVARGCSHYRRPGDEEIIQSAAGPEIVSDVELAIGLISAAQQFDSIYVRCAAQLLTGESGSAEETARLAVRERATAPLRHIARAALEMDAPRRNFWERLLALLPDSQEVPEGRLPHRSRFVSETGIVYRNGHLDRGGSRTWLSPKQPRSS